MAIRFPEIGELFLDRYEVTEVLGRGGMSRVYGAVQRGIDRKVAIKVLAPAGAENLSDQEFERVAKRFEREAKIVSKLRSPHTMVMHDYGQRDELLYMILEYVDGTNLHELVRAHGAIPEPRVVRIVKQVLGSLAEAHSMGVLHRDIKPQNIMVFEHLGSPDYVKVLDFGIAKLGSEAQKAETQLTGEQTIVGTPSYMSPEQILNQALDARTDIYSLGLVAFELAFGVVAVESESNFSTMAHHLSPKPIEFPDDRLSPGMRQVLERMIKKPRDERYGSAIELMHDLEALEGGSLIITPPEMPTADRMHTQPDRPAPTGPMAAGTPFPEPLPLVTSEGVPPSKKLYATAAVMLLLVAILGVVAVNLIIMMMDKMREPEAAAEIPPAAVVEPVAAEEPPPADPAPAELAVEEPAAPAEAAGVAEDEPVEVAEGDTPAADPTDEPPKPAARAARKKSQPVAKSEPKPETKEEPVPTRAEPSATDNEPAATDLAATQTAPAPVEKPVETPPKDAPPAKISPTVTATPTTTKTTSKKEPARSSEDEEPPRKKKKKKKQEPGVYSF